MFIRKANFRFYYGPDIVRHIENLISLHWNRVDSPREGELMFHNFIEISWNWLPEIRFFKTTPELEDKGEACFNSANWTGRDPKRLYFRWLFKARFNLSHG